MEAFLRDKQDFPTHCIEAHTLMHFNGPKPSASIFNVSSSSDHDGIVSNAANSQLQSRIEFALA